MVLGMLYGVVAGLIAGMMIGKRIFREVLHKRSFARLDYTADFDDDIPEPATGGKVSQKLKTILGFTDEWAKQPDYQRVTWFNYMMKTLWPYVCKTAQKEAMAQAKPALVDVCNMVPMGILESIDLEVVEMGEAPIRLGGLKVYDSREDNLMTEGVVIFGSGMRLRLGIKLRIPGIGYAVYLPVQVSDIQVRAVSRITLSPIVETLPCVGGVSITLLESPYMDAKFSLINGMDILGLPIIHEAFQYAVKYVLEGMLVYPNKMDFPVMENFGKVPPPLGMLEVSIQRAEGLPNSDFLSKSDPYTELSVREGRVLRTRTIDNDLNPTWNQRFNLLVDDIDTQSLLLVVKDDDLGFEDDVLGVAEIEFATADFIKKPRQPEQLSLKLMPGDSLGNAAGEPGGKKKKKGGPALQKKSKKKSKDAKYEQFGRNGTIHLEVRFLPFVSPEAQEEAAKKLEEARRKAMQLGQLKRKATKSTLDMRGVLTVNVHRCLNLEEKSGEVDAYVRLTLFDPSTGNTEAFRTNVQINDPSPRFNQKFDFIDVPAISWFTATVYDKSGLIESRLSLTPWKQKPDVELGNLRLNVEEVARNKVMKDMWPLLNANKGDIELTLSFQPIIFQDDEEEGMGFDGVGAADQPGTDGSHAPSGEGTPAPPGGKPPPSTASPSKRAVSYDETGLDVGDAIGTAIGRSRFELGPRQRAASGNLDAPPAPEGTTARPAVRPPHQ